MDDVSVNGIAQTHPNENLDPFWVGHYQWSQTLLMAFEREEKSGKNATPCCTHPISSLGKDIHHRIGRSGIESLKLSDI